MSRALSVTDLLSKKYTVLQFTEDFEAAFGTPEAVGTWLVWGGTSNGKTQFILQLCKELSKFGKGVYNSLEQGGSKSMQDAFKVAKMHEVKRKLLLVQEPIEALSERLLKPKSPWFVIIDSFQYTGMTYKAYQKFKETHRDKLIIFVSHADGKKPSGRAAQAVVYDVDQKIWVEGFKAFNLGRSQGTINSYIIWDQKAKEYHGV
jgi:hypothetical protein